MFYLECMVRFSIALIHEMGKFNYLKFFMADSEVSAI